MSRPILSKDIILKTCKIFSLYCHYNEKQANQIFDVYERGDSGYELAKKLEEYYYWDITKNDLDALEYFDSEVDEQYDEICWEWVRSNDIKPKLSIGDRISCGIIHGISDSKPASYEVKENDCEIEGRFLLLRFEDAEK